MKNWNEKRNTLLDIFSSNYDGKFDRLELTKTFATIDNEEYKVFDRISNGTARIVNMVNRVSKSDPRVWRRFVRCLRRGGVLLELDRGKIYHIDLKNKTILDSENGVIFNYKNEPDCNLYIAMVGNVMKNVVGFHDPRNTVEF